MSKRFMMISCILGEINTVLCKTKQEAINAMRESIDDSELYGVFQEREDGAEILSECDNFAVDGVWKIVEL